MKICGANKKQSNLETKIRMRNAPLSSEVVGFEWINFIFHDSWWIGDLENESRVIRKTSVVFLFVCLFVFLCFFCFFEQVVGCGSSDDWDAWTSPGVPEVQEPSLIGFDELYWTFRIEEKRVNFDTPNLYIEVIFVSHILTWWDPFSIIGIPFVEPEKPSKWSCPNEVFIAYYMRLFFLNFLSAAVSWILFTNLKLSTSNIKCY